MQTDLELVDRLNGPAPSIPAMREGAAAIQRLVSTVNRMERELEAALIAAYERGAEWTRENPDSSEYVKKAARDYADNITSPANT